MAGECAAFLVSWANARHVEVDDLALQKLMYMAGIDYSKSHGGAPMFPERFLAWRYGPVIPRLYDAYARWGSGPIGEPAEPVDAGAFAEAHPDEAACLVDVLERYRQQDGDRFRLVRDCEADEAWKRAYAGGTGSIIESLW